MIFNSGSNLIGGKGGHFICRGNWSLKQRVILSSPQNILAGCGDKEEMYRLICIKSRNFYCVANNEIGIVDSLPLNEIAHKSDSDSDSGWE